MQNVQVSSFFLIGMIGEEKGLLLGTIITSYNMSCIIFSICCFWLNGYRYGLTFTGSAPCTKGMAWLWDLVIGKLACTRKLVDMCVATMLFLDPNQKATLEIGLEELWMIEYVKNTFLL